MSSSATAHTWILLENQRCFLLCHLCCSILLFGGKVLWKNTSYKPERSGSWESGWAVLTRKTKQLITQDKKERKVQQMWDLHAGFPVLWAVPCPGLQVLGADHSQHLLVERLQFTEGIKVPKGVGKSVRLREMHINPLHRSGREGTASLSPACSAVLYRGTHREMREQGGTLLPLPPSETRPKPPSESCFHFQFTAAQFKKNRPWKKLPQSKMLHVGSDTECGSAHNKYLQFAKLERARFASKSGDNPQQDRWLHRSAAVPFNKRHTVFWKHFNFELNFVSLC